MNIDQARTNTSNIMNVTDMIAVAHEYEEQRKICGEPERVVAILKSYYGGFNVASDTSNFDRLRA